MMKNFLLALCCALALSTGSAAAQNTEKMLERITSAAASMNSMKCDFVQTRRMTMLAEEIKSTGVMVYEKPSRLCWKYISPTKYCLTVDTDSVKIDSEDGQTVSDANSSRLYKGIADMILGCMSGQMLKDSRAFSVKMTDMGSEWTAQLRPVRKDLKRLFESLSLSFDPKSGLLRSMTMNDAGGNTTVITISNVSLNGNYGVKW